MSVKRRNAKRKSSNDRKRKKRLANESLKKSARSARNAARKSARKGRRKERSASGNMNVSGRNDENDEEEKRSGIVKSRTIVAYGHGIVRETEYEIVRGIVQERDSGRATTPRENFQIRTKILKQLLLKNYSKKARKWPSHSKGQNWRLMNLLNPLHGKFSHQNPSYLAIPPPLGMGRWKGLH
jgi:hypothetical protein